MVEADSLSSSSLAEKPKENLFLWNVPYSRNPHFTGHDDLFERLDQHLILDKPRLSGNTRYVALTQPQAIKGLGGIGKTQVAVEYAYRSREREQEMHTLWIHAESEEAIRISFMTLAELLPASSERQETDQQKLITAVKNWLEQCPHPWLLIFDNADDLSLAQEYLPQQGNGRIVFTTRAQAVGSFAASLEVETMGFGRRDAVFATSNTKQGKYEQAKSFAQRALAIREQYLGSDHPDTRASMRHLAELYQQQGKEK